MSKVFKNPTAQRAIDLYHRRMREARIVKTLHMEKDGVCQFVLAGMDVECKELRAQIGVKVK